MHWIAAVLNDYAIVRSYGVLLADAEADALGLDDALGLAEALALALALGLADGEWCGLCLPFCQP